ncbi:hypothetical protein GZL_00339 [Streptomyces sp. 769]|nr:hypothetical protein GZL_00339 [Streptomyces sp. 769]
MRTADHGWFLPVDVLAVVSIASWHAWLLDGALAAMTRRLSWPTVGHCADGGL